MVNTIFVDPDLKVVDGQIVNGEIHTLETHVPPQYICSAIRDVECPICGYACTSANSSRQQQLKAVKNHMNSNKLHQVSTEKSANFPFGCKDCNLYFRWEVHLSGHQTTVEAACTLERIEKEAEEASRAAERSAPIYTKNQRIEGNYIGGVKWFSGTIQKVNRDGTYNLKYDDGDVEEKVSPKRIRDPSKACTKKSTSATSSKESKDNGNGNGKRKNVNDGDDDDVPASALFTSELSSRKQDGKNDNGNDDGTAPAKKKRGRPAAAERKK